MGFNHDIAELCGIHAGDGYLRDDGKRREFEISGGFDERDYYDYHVIPLINRFFGLNIQGRFFYTKSTYGFVLRDRKVIAFMHYLGFPYGKKSNIVRAPNIIMENKLFYPSFLRGYFDTEGCLTFDTKGKCHNYPRIIFSTVSKELAKNLNEILEELDFNIFFYKYKPKKQTESLKYAFNINGNENLNRWMSQVGIANCSKVSRYLVWKKQGFCQPRSTYKERLNILDDKLKSRGP